MEKQYRVIKEMPCAEVGPILTAKDNSPFILIEDDKDEYELLLTKTIKNGWIEEVKQEITLSDQIGHHTAKLAKDYYLAAFDKVAHCTLVNTDMVRKILEELQ